jgi:Predicted membrane protein
VRIRKRALLAKFFADRGTHLAAMIAYFALLSFVPLTFLALALLGFAGRADESSFLVKELKRDFPGTSVAEIVDLVGKVQQNAATLGIVGGAFLLWSALSLFSVLESAFNIVYGRSNRSFLRGKAIAFGLMVGSLVTLFVSLLAGSFGAALLDHYAPGLLGNGILAYVLSAAISALGVFAFLVSVYYLLTNEDLSLRDVLPGAAFATIALELSFQILPVYLRFANLNPTLRIFSAPAILLVWLYFMANGIVLGAELNWWWSRRRRQQEADEGIGLA